MTRNNFGQEEYRDSSSQLFIEHVAQDLDSRLTVGVVGRSGAAIDHVNVITMEDRATKADA